MIAEMDRQELEESSDILYEYEYELNKMLDNFQNEREDLMEIHDVHRIKEYEEYGKCIDKMEIKVDD